MKKPRTTAVPGPRDCWRTRNVIAPCDVCGAHPEVVHVPMRGRGFRCSEHCEYCVPAASAPADQNEGNTRRRN
jgi:hypothetical protein